uniref:glucan 1,3-beta-glucosidase n=1 Tax=Mycena chlorophos TaxID=658473 RepID=A0ABQ0M8D6_MYCCL|nr:glycoside hydrolase [Mycena chlorophos]
MSNPPPPIHPGTGGVDYEPLPLTHQDSDQPRLYNAPPSPSESSFHLPPVDSNGVPYTDDIALAGIPMGAAQPRFLGRALYDGGPDMRNSIASHSTFPSSDRGSQYTDSVYGLQGGAAGRNYSESSYQDDPGFFVHGDQPRLRNEKRAAYAKPRSRRKPILIGVGVLALVVIIAIVIAVVVRHKSSDDSSSSGNSTSASSSGTSGSTSSGAAKVNLAVSGSDGSTVYAEDGSTFTYVNKFGGTWYYDVNDPFNNAAQPQSWTPPLNQTFQFGVDPIRGVNLGGWLVTEPFIVPGLYQTIQSRETTTAAGITIIDEWTLIQALQLDTANNGTAQLEEHYATFITEQDFMQIAAAGLNFVRIPLGYWAIEVLAGEEFLPNVSWTYFLKAVQWARKYGLRINLDLHALPGSQNGWNHSGRLGSYNVLYGPMGIANAQRSLDYVRILAEFISQPEYSDVVVMFGITNEPQGNAIGLDTLGRYYYQAYLNVRGASGYGAGNGPMVSFHDGFISLSDYAGFMSGSDRASLDTHPYLCFTQSAAPITTYSTTPCSAWGGEINSTMGAFGLIVAGEFSNAVTDCGLYVNGVGQGVRYEGTYDSGGPWPVIGNCTTDWLNYQEWSSGTKAAYLAFAEASMDALGNWFFWTWKIGNSTAGIVEAPQWSYQLGLQEGWMPTDPRSAVGTCGDSDPWDGPLSAWQTNGASGQIAADYISNSLAWPPPTISFANSVNSPGNALPTYTPSGTPVTLPVQTFAAITVSGQVVSATSS